MKKVTAQALIVCTCAICATYLIANGVDGWGWLIFLGALVLL